MRHGPRERRTGPPLWLLRPVDTLGHPFVACIGVKLKTCFQKILLRNLIARSNNYDASTIRKSESVESSARYPPPPLPYSRFPIQSARRINFKIGRSLFKRTLFPGTKIESRREQRKGEKEETEREREKRRRK